MAFEQQQDLRSQIAEKHGDTIVSTLRAIYGPSFAPDCQPTAMLSDVLAELDDPSFRHLADDHRAGCLNEKLVEQS